MESSTPDKSPFDREVRRIRELLQSGQYDTALTSALSLKAEVPTNRDVLYMIAVAYRFLQRTGDALTALAELEKHHPEYSRLHQERGHCQVAMRSPGRAIDAFLRAVTLNPSLPASWKALQALYEFTGQKAYAIDAAAHVANLSAVPAEIVTAYSMFADGEINAAEDVVRRYLLQHGNHVEGMLLLARIGMRLDVADDAEVLLENILVLAPEHHTARYEYAVVLLQRHKHLRAQEEIEKLRRMDPDNPIYRITHATICVGIGDFERAVPLYRQALTETPRNAELHLSIAHAFKTMGRTEAAIGSYRDAAAARPAFGEAYWSLANLKTYRFTDLEIARMVSEENSPEVQAKDRYHLCFALGKALEDRADYAGSFVHYERGNALKKAECRYRPETVEQNCRAQASLCTRDFFDQRRSFGSKDRSPIFIVGLPRSGSTLIEQILASHSQVEGTMELADIPRLAHDLQGHGPADPQRYADMLAALGAEQCLGLGDRYLADTLTYRIGKPHFIDKMPNNWRHIALIHLMLPNAKIIDARREPMACCFSNFKQLFASGQEFTYSFEDIARYYSCYVELMAHWDAVLPSKILRIQHEILVDDFNGTVRRILEFCGLEFEPGCLDFYKTERRVHTASSEQVRQPLYREGLDQWRRFEPWLGPLKDALAVESR